MKTKRKLLLFYSSSKTNEEKESAPRSDRKTHDESLPVVAGRMVGAPNDDDEGSDEAWTEKLYGETAPWCAALGDIFFSKRVLLRKR